jgi:hypothetical protein
MRAIGSHPNIIRCIECGINVDRVFISINREEKINYLAIEYAQNGNLLECL